MRNRSRWSVVLAGLFCTGAGYLLGVMHARQPAQAAVAQEGGGLPSEDAVKRILAVNDAIKQAAEALRLESRYEVATKSLNLYGILTGGINAKEDLESGRGVDPETFAGLYAGDGAPGVVEHLRVDDDGRLTYKDKVVRLYPVSRLKKLHGQRQILTGEVRAKDAE